MSSWYVQIRMKVAEDDVQQARELAAQRQDSTSDGYGCHHPDLLENKVVLWQGDCCPASAEECAIELSQQFPHVELEVHYSGSGEDADEAKTMRYRNGDAKVVYSRYAYFQSCSPGTAPVHHWDIELVFETENERSTVVAALNAQGVVIEGNETGNAWGYRATARKGGNELMAWLAERFPDVKVSKSFFLPYTLDEEYYLHVMLSRVHSLCPVGRAWVPPRIPEDVQQHLRIAERDIDLTPEEIHWVIEGLVEKAFTTDGIYNSLFPRLQQLRHHVGHAEFDTRYLDTMRQICSWHDRGDYPRVGRPQRQFEAGFVLLTPAEAAELGYCRPYQPTKGELEIVLDYYAQHPELPDTEARIGAIKAAIAAPRWTKEWPQWDRATEDSSAQQPSSDPNDPNDTFLRQLESLEASEESQADRT